MSVQAEERLHLAVEFVYLRRKIRRQRRYSSRETSELKRMAPTTHDTCNLHYKSRNQAHRAVQENGPSACLREG